MTLRTLVLSVGLLAPMVWLWPTELFMALTTRGDWFLDGVEGTWAAPTRTAVLGAADGLVWVYDQAHENPWRASGDAAIEVAGDGHALPTQSELEVSNEDGAVAAEDAGPTPADEEANTVIWKRHNPGIFGPGGPP